MFPTLLDLIVSTAIALQLGPILRIAVLLLHEAVVIYAIANTNTKSFNGYLLRAAVAIKFFTAWNYLWLTEPLKEYRHELDKVSPGQRSFWYRMYWSQCFIINSRGVGLNCQVPYTPSVPVELQQRWQFLKSRTIRASVLYLIVDAINTYHTINPILEPSGLTTCESPLTCQGYKLGLVTFVSFPLISYALMNLGYTVFSIIAVAFGISQPKYWPDLFGSPREAYTVRHFWGRFWHQAMRQFLTSIGKSTARSLGFTTGSTGSAYTQIFIAFTISGIIHAVADIYMGKGVYERTFKFFFFQAFAIVFEDIIIAVAKRAGLSHSTRLTRWVGYSWVCLWFGYFLPYYIKWCVEFGGVTTKRLLPFSPARLILAFLEKHYGIDVPALLFN